MLVFSRKLGESFIINDDEVGTVVEISPNSVRLLLGSLSGDPPRSVTLSKSVGRVDLGHGIKAVFIRARDDRARFGFEIPSSVRFARIEDSGSYSA